MADNELPVTGNPAPETTPTTEPASTGGQTPIASLPPDIQDYLHRLREENAKWRTDAKKAQEKALRDNQQWQQLAETREKELEELKPYKEKAELLEKGFNATLEARLKTIPTDVRKSLVEPVRQTMSAVDFARWLDANEAMLKTKTPPPVNAGAGGEATPADTSFGLTADELEVCKLTRVSPAQYAKRKAEKLADQRSAT